MKVTRPQKPDSNYVRLQRWARSKFAQAVKLGIIQREFECADCGKHGPCDAHHTDYTKPYHVKWLCKGCHNARPKHSVTMDIDISKWPNNHISNVQDKGLLRVPDESREYFTCEK